MWAKRVSWVGRFGQNRLSSDFDNSQELFRFVGYPDAPFRNEDNNSHRGLAIFLAEQRKPGKVKGKGNLIEYESRKVKTLRRSTTVAQLHALTRCKGTFNFLKGLWADMSAMSSDLHVRRDANNSVAAARTTHLSEQKDTVHLIKSLGHECMSGSGGD